MIIKKIRKNKKIFVNKNPADARGFVYMIERKRIAY